MLTRPIYFYVSIEIGLRIGKMRTGTRLYVCVRARLLCMGEDT